MSPSLPSLVHALEGLEIALLLLLAGMVVMRALRVRRARITARARDWMAEKMLPLFDGDAEQRCEGRKVFIGDVLVVELPPPRGVVGDAVREVIADHLVFITGELRDRLVHMLEEAGYVSAAMRRLKSRNVEARIRTCMVLGGMHSRVAVPALIEVFRDDPDPFVRIGAAE